MIERHSSRGFLRPWKIHSDGTALRDDADDEMGDWLRHEEGFGEEMSRCSSGGAEPGTTIPSISGIGMTGPEIPNTPPKPTSMTYS